MTQLINSTIKMNFAEEFAGQFKDIKNLRKITKDVINKGGKLAHEKYYKTKRLTELRRLIKNS